MEMGIDKKPTVWYIMTSFCVDVNPHTSPYMPVIGGQRGTRQGRSIPRIRHAARLYASGAVRTKQEAAEAVGVNPSYFNIVTQPGHARSNPQIIELMDEIERSIHDKTVSLSSVIEAVSREAVEEMRDLINNSQNEAIRLKAASDILDRNPETSKTQKHQLSSFSLGSEDAKALAAALVKSAEAQRLYGHVGKGDFVRIPMEAEDAGQFPLSAEVRRLNEGVAERAVERVLESASSDKDLGPCQVCEGTAPEDAAGQGLRASQDTIRERVRALTSRPQA